MGAGAGDMMKGYPGLFSANAGAPLLLAVATVVPLTVSGDSGEAAWLPRGCRPDPAGPFTLFSP